MSKYNSTNRFSNRAADYAKYRPHYPTEIVNWITSTFHVLPHVVIADLGAGTGISSELFLIQNFQVIAVEPNTEMRQTAIAYLEKYPNFSAVDGTAENTTLADQSVDVIVSAQAFHWFDLQLARKEFLRILKPDGLVVLIWNERLIQSPFEIAYEKHILEYATDYIQINHRNVDLEKIKNFFLPYDCHLNVFRNSQVLDYEGFKGRHLSSSFIPQEGDQNYAVMIKNFRQLFDEYQIADEIIINYDTKVYVAVIGNSN